VRLRENGSSAAFLEGTDGSCLISTWRACEAVFFFPFLFLISVHPNLPCCSLV
jgi:hypothetical protein